MNNQKIVDIIGVGSPIIDMHAFVDDHFIQSIDGEKGGMELVDAQSIDKLLNSIGHEPVRKPGGAAANTIFALTRLGIATAFLGMVGEDDEARYYRDAYARIGGYTHLFKAIKEAPTARCLNMITSDSERTMRTDLGAASRLEPALIAEDDFRSAKHIHIEGYLLFNPELMEHVLRSAKASGCTVSFDLGSFEVVHAAREILPELLNNYIDMVFANEEEARAFCGDSDLYEAAGRLGELCSIAAVKVGKEGSFITEGNGIYHVEASPVENPLDTTGAGDYWAAGFLYGKQQGYDLETCGWCASVLSGEVVRHVGTSIEDEHWKNIHTQLKQLSV